MCIRVVYEAIDSEIKIELNKGTLIHGILRGIDKRENLLIETPSKTVLVSSTAINALILPDSLSPLLNKLGCKTVHTTHGILSHTT